MLDVGNSSQLEFILASYYHYIHHSNLIINSVLELFSATTKNISCEKAGSSHIVIKK
jgi:hypothetical protein